jgi:hypothetical protein
VKENPKREHWFGGGSHFGMVVRVGVVGTPLPVPPHKCPKVRNPAILYRQKRGWCKVGAQCINPYDSRPFPEYLDSCTGATETDDTCGGISGARSTSVITTSEARSKLPLPKGAKGFSCESYYVAVITEKLTPATRAGILPGGRRRRFGTTRSGQGKNYGFHKECGPMNSANRGKMCEPLIAASVQLCTNSFGCGGKCAHSAPGNDPKACAQVDLAVRQAISHFRFEKADAFAKKVQDEAAKERQDKAATKKRKGKARLKARKRLKSLKIPRRL